MEYLYNKGNQGKVTQKTITNIQQLRGFVWKLTLIHQSQACLSHYIGHHH